MFKILCQLFIRNSEATHQKKVQIAYIRLYTIFNISLGLVCIIYKLTYGILFNSLSLTNDALESVTDVISSLIIFISYKISFIKPSLRYPFGRGRVLYIANFFISFLLIITSVELIIMAIKNIIFQHSIPSFQPVIILVIVISILINEWISFFGFYIAKTIQSSLMKAEAYHRRSDTYLSLIVLLSWGGSLLGYYWVDSIGGLFFAILIGKSAYSTIKENMPLLLGSSPSLEEVSQIKKIANDVKEVINIHEIIIHNYGFQKIISCHIGIDSKLSLKEAHSICDEVEKQIYSQLHYFCITHPDPIDQDDPQIISISHFLEQLLINNDTISSQIERFHDIYLFQNTLKFDIFTKKSLKKKEEIMLKALLKNSILKHFSQIDKILPTFKPLFSTTLTTSQEL